MHIGHIDIERHFTSASKAFKFARRVSRFNKYNIGVWPALYDVGKSVVLLRVAIFKPVYKIGSVYVKSTDF